MDDDAQVVARVLAGEVEAFRVLVERYQATVFRLVRGLIPDRDEQEDLAQEVFMRAFTRLQHYRGHKAAFSTWLLTLGRNLCINALKKRRPAPLRHDPPVRDFAQPEAALHHSECTRALDAALAALPDEQRNAFVLSSFVGLSYADIAAIEQVEIGTVKSRISRARATLQARILEPQEQAP